VSHTGEIGGGEISLLELLARLPAGIEPVAAVPKGPLRDEVARLGVPTLRFAGTRASLRVTPAGVAISLAEVARSAAAVRSAVARTKADVVHANSLRAAVVSALPSRAQLVAFVRDTLPESRLAQATQRFVARRAARVVANSRFTASRFAAVTGSEPLVLPPPIDLDRFAGASDRAAARASLGIREGDGPVLGVVAQLTPWKGQADAIEALALLRREFPAAVLVLAGSVKFNDPRTRFDNDAYETSLEEAVDRFGLAGAVRFLGDRSDVPSVLAALDVLLCPSWEEPFGRSVAEAMASGVPVVATEHGGPSEQIVDGVDGILLPPRRPQLWADTVGALVADLQRRTRMAAAARDAARHRFDADAHAERVVALYETLTHGAPDVRHAGATKEQPT
jgi:glycosyltransferase involved in cell wall biosynthesis